MVTPQQNCDGDLEKECRVTEIHTGIGRILDRLLILTVAYTSQSGED